VWLAGLSSHFFCPIDLFDGEMGQRVLANVFDEPDNKHKYQLLGLT